MKYKNLIFDVGGIIFDDSKAKAAEFLGYESPDDENFRATYHKAFSGDFREALVGRKTIAEHLAKLREEADYAQIQALLDPSRFDQSFPLLADNYHAITALRQQGYKLYILSNMNAESAEYIRNCVALDQDFDGIVFSCEAGLAKPNPQIYQLITGRYHLNKAETIFFDDKERNVIAARQSGIAAEIFTNMDDVTNALK